VPDLCIQIHPHRSPDLNIVAVRSICEGIAEDKGLVRAFSLVDGTDGHYYVNLMFNSDRLEVLWDLLQRRLYQTDGLGPAMRRSSMAMCEGEHGWDDYLLLCHFDPNVECTSFPSRLHE
jgi:hypothetical protein